MSGANLVILFLSDGGSPPSFSAVIVSSVEVDPESARAVDIDEDGCMDVVSGGYGNSILAWHKSDCGSTPTFSRNVIASVAHCSGVDTGDLNGDGWADIVAIDYGSNSAHIFLSSGGFFPTFTSVLLMTSSTTVILPTIADLNSDGFADVVLPIYGAGTVQWYQSDGASVPSFSSHMLSSSVMVNPSQTTVSDLDRDG